MKTKLKRFFKFFSISSKDILLTCAVLFIVTFVCMLLRQIDSGNGYVYMLYILAVFVISRITKGYFFGIISSVISVLAVNFIFSEPFFRFDFSLTGYPLTMMCMLVVAITTGTLTSQIKEHSQIKLEVEKEKTRSNLLRAISHDLRTPLTSILGASSAIIENDDKIDKEKRIKLLSEIKEDSQWLIAMVENLLSITRIDDDDSTKIIKTEEVAEELIAVSLTKFKKRYPDMQLEVTVPDELLIVPMDAVLIEQVIINLLENAVIHAHGATTIALSVSQEGGNAVFNVADNGCGIAKNVLPHIFDGYLKGSAESGDTKRNMGIGLSVCSTIIKAHGGKLTAKNSKENGGAIFTFTLPLEADNNEQQI